MIRKILLQALTIFFIIMTTDYLMNTFNFMKKISIKIYLVLAIISYIGLQSLLKIQENYVEYFEDNEEPIMEDEEPMMEDEEPIMEDEEPIMEDEEPIMEDEEPIMEDEEPIMEVPKTNAELSSEIPNQMEDKSGEMEKEEQREENKNELVKQEKTPKEDLKKIQDKYIIMPVESWIKNDINLMKEKQTAESCSCPTVLDGSFATY